MRPSGPIQSDSPAVLAADGPLLRVPDGFDIFTAQYSRAGDDLVIAAEASPPLTVVGYFAEAAPPALVAPNGAMLTGNVVELLAGSRAPGHYAQADAPEGATPIGEIEVLSGTATATRASGETVALAQSDPVFQGDVIETGGDSKLGIRLEDGTLASMSAQSRLVLNEFVYDAGGSDNWMLVDLIEGSFAFLTGAIAPSGGMEITTPVAVMAIRGTLPIAIVTENGPSQFFAGSDQNYELLHLTTKQLLAVITSATGYALGSPDAALQTIDIDPETLDEINELIDVLNDAAASLGFLGIMADSGFHSYSSFGSIGIGALFQFLQLLDGSLTEEAIIEVEDPNQFLMAEPVLVADPDQADTVEELPVEVDVLANDSHPDGGELTVVFAGVPNGQGTVVITDDQQLLYDPGTAFNHLALGETAEVVITYAVSHPSGAIVSTTATVTVTGLNQAPVIVPVAATNANEQTDTQPLETTISLAFSDIDLNNVGHTVEVTGVAVAGETSGLTLDDAGLMALLTPGLVTKLAGEAGGSVSFDFSIASGVLDYLAVGEVVTLTYTVEIDDGDGGVTPHSFDVMITGTNDAPVIDVATSEVSGTVVETGFDAAGNPVGNPQASGQILASDVDNGGVTYSVLPAAGAYGVLTVDATGAWTYVLNDTAADFLALGESDTDAFTVTVTDNFGGTDNVTVTLTITGANDAPTILGEATEASGEVSELADQSGSQFLHEVDGQIVFGDVDVSDTHTVDVVAGGDGYLGSLVLGAVDQTTKQVTWTFSVTDAALDQLPKNTSIVQTYTVTIDDGNGGTVEQVVTITINGSNDAPVIVIGDGDRDSAELDETDSGLQADGTLSVSDVSVTDLVTASVTEVAVSGAHANQIANGTLLGFLTVTSPVLGSPGADGTLTWTFDSLSEAFDFLAAGEELVLTYTVTVNDGTTTSSHEVTVTINGSNDGPEITVGEGDSIGDELEETDAGLQAEGTLSVEDVDISDEVTAEVTQVTATGDHNTQISNTTLLGFLTVTGTVIGDGAIAGTLDWAFDSVTEAFDFLAVDEQLVLTYTIRVADGKGGTHTQEVTVTVTGTNDDPTIVAGSTDATGAVTEQAGATGSETELVDGGTIAFADLDLSDTHTATFAENADGYLGSFALGAVDQGANNVGWTFTVEDGALDHLAAGEQVIQSYTVTIDDGKGGTVEQVVNVTITGSNDAPVADATTASGAEDAVSIAIILSGSDVDGGDAIESFSLTGLPGNGTLYIDAALTIEAVTGVDYDATGNELTLYFAPDSDFNGEVDFTYTASDGALDSAEATATITVDAVNDAPVADLNGDGGGIDNAAIFTEDEGPVAIAPDGTLSDVDNQTLQSMTVTLSSVPDGELESLSLTAAAQQAADDAGLTVDYDPATGVLSITGEAALEVYQTILQGIEYDNTSQNPDSADRDITVVVSDGELSSTVATTTMEVVAVPDPISFAILTVDDPSINEYSSGDLGTQHPRLFAIVGDGDQDLDGGETAFKLSNNLNSEGGLLADNNADDPVLITANGPTANGGFGDHTGSVTFSNDIGFGLNDLGGEDKATDIYLNDKESITFQLTGGVLLAVVAFTVSALGGPEAEANVTIDIDGEIGATGFSLGTLAHGDEIVIDFVEKTITVNGVLVVGTESFFADAAGTDSITIGSTSLAGETGDGAGLGIHNLQLTPKEASATDPIVLDLGEPGFDLSGTASFDLDADGQAETLAWTGGEDAILAMDLDGSGSIDSGKEVFSPFFGSGGFADALAALASLDGNGDGVIDGKDEAFADLLAWVDANSDGQSQPDELISLADLGIESFDLNAGSVAYEIDGQSIVAEGQYTKADGTTGNYVAVELDRIPDASEPLIAGNDESDIDAPDQEVAATNLSIDDLLVDYGDGSGPDLAEIGFAMATGQDDYTPAYANPVSELSVPPDILVKLTEQHDAANVEFA